MKKLYSIVLLTAALSVVAGCHQDVPITEIVVDPTSATLFVGESFDLHVQYLPADATNSDEIQIYSSNEKVATYENGKVTAKDAGTAAISATCVNVATQCKIKVYKYALHKGSKTYGIDYAHGYQLMMGEATPQALELYLVHNAADGTTQNLQFWIRTEQLGKDIDFTKDAGDALISVYANNNEDGYCIYMSEDGPVIVTADWTSTGFTLKRGILHVEHTQFSNYLVRADFELSNGYRFSTDWEGNVSLKVE